MPADPGDTDAAGTSSFGEQAFVLLRGQIVDGTLRPGERLVEREIAEQLGFSRVPVREALQRLERAGLVNRERQRVTRVGVPTERDVLEMLEVRESLEPLAARLAAQRVDAAGRRLLRGILGAAGRASRTRDQRAFASANASFHWAWVELAGNRVLADMMSEIGDRTRWLFGMTSDLEPNRMHTEHRAVYDAIASGDADAAAALAYDHVLRTREPTLELLRRMRANRGTRLGPHE